MTEIFVVDIETTGLIGGPSDLVVDIGIVLADTDESTVEDWFSTVVGYPETVMRRYAGSWVFRNTDLTLNQVCSAPGCQKVIERVSNILSDELVTSYNTDFDLQRFLLKDPWNLSVYEAPCIMKSALEAYPDCSNGHYPRLQRIYDMLCPDDPAKVDGNQRHRALSDARQAAHVLLKMFSSGHYLPEAIV